MKNCFFFATLDSIKSEDLFPQINVQCLHFDASNASSTPDMIVTYVPMPLESEYINQPADDKYGIDKSIQFRCCRGKVYKAMGN